MRWIPGTTIADLEKMAITDAMIFYQGRRTEVAQVLGISTRCLYNKLEEYEKEAALAVEKEARDQKRRDDWIRQQRGELVTPMEDPLEDVQPIGLPKRTDEATEETVESQKAVGGRRGR